MRMRNIYPLLATRALLLSCLLAGVAVNVRADQVMTDQAIMDKVDDELEMDQAVNSLRVDVVVNDGIATLTGNVDNILAKERAARISEAVKGVRAVVNQLVVRPAVTRTDTEIKRDVERALLEDPAVNSEPITVSVQDGIVSLAGSVNSFAEQKLALHVAKAVRGVLDVREELDVSYRTDRPDADIQHDIEEKLRWNILVDHQLIHVEVADGDVTLHGNVGSASEKRIAESAAWVAGVSSVDASQLAVSTWARDDKMRGDKFVIKSADEVRKAVRDAMLYDPRVASFKIDVDVLAGVVTLRGVVDNLPAKLAAEQDAQNTVGVFSVVNRIKVRPTDHPADAAIADSIRAALRRDPYVEWYDFTVVVVNGTARLYGTVDSYYERNRAQEVAGQVAGVISVDNRVTADSTIPYFYDPYVDEELVVSEPLVKYEQRAPLKSDSEILKSIESELWWSPFVNSNQVNVLVDDGIATLTGTVDSWSEFRSATENAYEGGATLVDNDLVVNYQ
jgi:osmotically-inducible protein OsmY